MVFLKNVVQKRHTMWQEKYAFYATPGLVAMVNEHCSVAKLMLENEDSNLVTYYFFALNQDDSINILYVESVLAMQYDGHRCVSEGKRFDMHLVHDVLSRFLPGWEIKFDIRGCLDPRHRPCDITKEDCIPSFPGYTKGEPHRRLLNMFPLHFDRYGTYGTFSYSPENDDSIQPVSDDMDVDWAQGLETKQIFQEIAIALQVPQEVCDHAWKYVTRLECERSMSWIEDKVLAYICLSLSAKMILDRDSSCPLVHTISRVIRNVFKIEDLVYSECRVASALCWNLL